MTLLTESAFSEPAPSLGVVAFRDWYRSHAVFESETEKILARSWSVVAPAEALADPGVYATAVVGGVPLVVIRGDDGVLRGFHNLCRHRGIPVVTGSGVTGSYLTCPYHQWSYRRDGSLARVPQQAEEFPTIDLAALGLAPAAVAEWGGIVFARPTPDGPSLVDTFGGLDHRLDIFRSAPLVEVACVEIEAACNWKMLVENHVDVYHLWYLHQRTLRQYDHRRFAWESFGESWWSLEPLRDLATAPTTLRFLDDTERASIGAHLLFPNIMIVTTGEYLATYEATPLAPDRTRLTLRIRSVPDADGDALVASVRSFLAEDVAACEQLQLATGSPGFALGPTARTHEEPVRRFHQAIRRHLTC